MPIHLVVSNSTLLSETDDRGNSGDMTINTETLVVREGAEVGTRTRGGGSAGSLTVNASESVEVSGVTLLESEGVVVPFVSRLNVRADGAGNVGNIEINTKKLFVRNGAIVSNTLNIGGGSAGTLTINASESVELSGTSTVEFGGIVDVLASSLGSVGDISSDGDVGDITITTGKLSVQDGASIEAATLGDGNAGDITIFASEVEVIGESTPGILGTTPSRIDTSSLGDGEAGTISVEADRLVVRDGGSLFVSSSGNGKAGSINIRVVDLELSGTEANGVFRSQLSAISSDGSAGEINVETRRLVVRDGAEIVTDTSGLADAGSITIEATDVEVSGITPNRLPSRLSASSRGAGQGGEIRVETERLTVRDGAEILARSEANGVAGSITILASDVQLIGTGEFDFSDRSGLFVDAAFGTGDAGSIIVETEQLIVRGGAVISSSTSSEGDAGEVSISASNIELIGASAINQLPSSVLAEVLLSAPGQGGNVNIETERFTVRDGAIASVSSRGTGQRAGNPGNLNVTAQDLRLDNQGSLTAISETGQGGNIVLQARDILLRRQSEISAVGSQDDPTFEGDININAETLVLLEGSRIVTSASDPQVGSNITVSPLTGTQLFVFVSPDSLIDAVGELTLETDLELDPPETPEIQVVDPAEQVAQNPCRQGVGSEFVITRRGGLPPSPTDALSSDAIEIGLVEPVAAESQVAAEPGSRGAGEPGAVSLVSERIAPAQGWVFNDKGEVALTAYDPTGTGAQRPRSDAAACSVAH